MQSRRARIELGDGYGRRETTDGEPIITAGWIHDARKVEAEAYEHMDAIRWARKAEIAAIEKQNSHVQALRAMGASWAVIGAALGISKAAAFKRYAHHELA